MSATQAADKKPNIVVIVGDDVGIWNISAYHRGMMGGSTPNIDRIAKEGALFTDYYAQQSCTAGRAAFILGQCPFLIIRRAPNLGEVLIISIDGQRVSELRAGDTYDAPVASGSHVLSAILVPNQLNLAPTKAHLNVQKGQTYAFTAAWVAETLVLRH